MPKTKVSLKVVTPNLRAIILQKSSPVGTPQFEGDESEDLVCGSCGAVIAKGVSLENFRTEFPMAVSEQLVVKCDCGEYNLLPSEVVPAFKAKGPTPKG
jgi:hypothetical protein